MPLDQLVMSADEVSFAELYHRTIEAVYAMVLSVLYDRTQAAEVTQEVYVQAWQSATSYCPSGGTVPRWLLILAHHRALHQVRHSQAARRRDHYLVREALANGVDPVADWVLARLELQHLYEAIDRLTDVQRESILLARIDGYTHIEIGRSLNLPLGTVKSRIRAGLQQLRVLMVTL